MSKSEVSVPGSRSSTEFLERQSRPNSLLGHPAFVIVALNLAFWGLPFAVVLVRNSTASQGPVANPAVAMIDSAAAQATNPLAVMPGVATASALPPLAVPIGSDIASQQPLVADGLDAMFAESATADPLPVLHPLRQLEGADGLGGAITLASLSEPQMPMAARAERLLQQRSGDPLAALPLHWREPLRKELGDRTAVSRVATVRLPVRSITERQEVPVVVNDSGQAEGLVMPRDPRIASAVETWAKRQPLPARGTIQVALVSAEPVDDVEQAAPRSIALSKAPMMAGPPPELPPLPPATP